MKRNLIQGTLLLLFALIVCTSAAVAQDTVTRDLPATANVSTAITVDLTVDVESNATFYAIDETVPTGWTVTSATSGGDYTSEAGHVKWVVTSGAADTVYSYTVLVPANASGTYTFDGIYAFEGMTAEATILGDTDVTVGGGTAEDTVTRDLPSTADAGTAIAANLTVDVESGATFYAIDETVPTGWTVTSATSGGDYTSDPGHVKWVVFSGVADTVYSYTVLVPANASGTYTFDGIYAFEGMTAEATILGGTDVDVAGGSVPFEVGGHVYLDTATVSGADVTVTNLNTSESLTTTTDSNGAYVVNLGNLPGGHNAGDLIQVTATYNGQTGTNSAPRSENLSDSPQIIDVTLSTHVVQIKAADGTSLPDTIPVGETFTVLIIEDGISVGAGTNVTFRLPYDTGDPVLVQTDDDGKARYTPLITGTLGIRVLNGTATVAEATVNVTITGTPVVSIESAECSVGGTVDVPISITGASNIGAMDIAVDYDASVLTATGVANGSMMASLPDLLWAYNISDGRMNISFATYPETVSGDGELFVVTFAADAAGNSTLDITVEEAWTGDATPQPVVPVTVEGCVNVTVDDDPDTTPPSAVTDLTATNPTTTTMTLGWTAPGDDGSTGTAASYDVRYRAGAAITESNWNSANQCTGEPTPGPTGSTETFVVTGLSPSTTYYFALKTADEVPNWSPISNSPQETTPGVGGPSVSIDPASTTGLPPGATFLINIHIDPDGNGVSGGEICLSFDTAVLEVTDLTKGDMLGTDAFDTGSDYNNTAGTVIAVLARKGATTPPTDAGTLSTVTFHVKADAADGTTTIAITSVGMVDESFTAITGITTTDGTATIVTLIGDINRDGTVNYIDLAMLGASYGLSVGETGYIAAADINGDGTVNYIDLAMLGAHYGESV